MSTILPQDLYSVLLKREVARKSDHQERVELFMRKAEQEVPIKPILPSEKTLALRADIILEEALETVRALGFEVIAKHGHGGRVGFDKDGERTYSLVQAHQPDLHQIVDGCCDVRVVTTGTLSACGVPDGLVQYEVDQNNLAKFGPGSYRRGDGKWMKPADHRPPRIEDIIRFHKMGG